jgi:hypothetical protein
MPHYFFDIKDGHGLVDRAGSDCKNDAAAFEKARGSRYRRFTRQTSGRSDAPHFCSGCGQGRNLDGAGIFQAHRAMTHCLRWRLQLPMKPAVCLGGFHRVGQIDNHVMDIVASRAFEGPDVKAGRAWGDACQHCCDLAHRARWSLDKHDASPRSGGSATLSVTDSCQEGGR